MYTADYPPGARLPPRIIDDFELVWMLRGQARFLTADAEIRLDPDVLLLVPPGLEHSFEWDPSRPSRHGYIHFRRANLEPRIEIRPMTPVLRSLCAYLIADDRARQETLDFMLTVIKLGPLPTPLPRLNPALQASIGHLRSHWTALPLQRITVQSLADKVHVTRGYLNRLFQNTFDVSASAALERIRCARAEALLARTDLTIDIIARQCGFADVSHFSHRFTQLHGIPPSTYRTNPATSVLDHPGIRQLNQYMISPPKNEGTWLSG
jgi:AraC family transcriptional regulator